jgi:[acyl-carrier-protein] S-malonyltransferase
VRWTECIDLLRTSGGATTFIEVGPGKVLSGLMRQIDRTVSTLNVEDSTSLEKTFAALSATNS